MGIVPARWPGIAGGGSGMYSFAAAGVLGLWAYLEAREFFLATAFLQPRLVAFLLAGLAVAGGLFLAFRVPGCWARALYSALAGAAVGRLLTLDGCAPSLALLSAAIGAGLVALDQFTLPSSCGPAGDS